MHQLDAGNRYRGVGQDLEAQHRPDARLHIAVIGLDAVVQVLRRSQLRVLPPRVIGRQFAYCAMRSSVAV